MSFKQKGFLESIEYDFYNQGVILTYKTPINKSVENIQYDEIGKEILRLSSGKKNWLIAASIFLLLAIVLLISSFTDDTITFADCLFYVFPGIACLFVFLYTKKEKVYLMGEKKSLPFLYNKKNIHDINEFVNEVIEKRNQYFKEKYAVVDYDIIPEKQIGKFRWLKEEGAITEEEYNYFIDQLQSLVRNTRIF